MSPKKLGLVGLVVAFLVALPIFVWSIINLNFNPKEKANEVIQLSICGDSCSASNICLNEEPWPQELTCYPEDADSGLCRNKACPDQPNCICQAPTSTPTPTATATSTPTQTPGVPNYCGGTCGSNYNCQANYYCYQGFCRNPVCPSDSNCDCIANAVATTTSRPKKTATAKPVKTATTKPTSTTGNITTGYKTSTPKSSATSSPTLHPALVEKNLENQFLLKYALPIFGVFALVVISTIFYALKKTRKINQIPHITPPINV